MWNKNQPANLTNLCQLTLLATQLGRLMVQKQLQRVDAQVKATGITASNIAPEYAVYSVKAAKQTAVGLGIKTPPVVEHVELNKDF